jgi:hypothetical protein
MARLTASVRAREALGGACVAGMYALYARYYDGVPPEQFRADLDAKSHVIELREDGSLRGFSTIALIDFECGGLARRAIFSGDTIIDHRYWGEQALPLAFCAFAGRVHAAEPARPLYWFLISKGYRTYRYLNVFARQYYPHADASTPPEEQACLDHLARSRFGEFYSTERGVLHFPRSRGHLKPEWAGVRSGVSARRDVRFFLERNPAYHAGDELVCITQLKADNLRSFARRAFLRGLAEFEHGGLLSQDSRQRGALPVVAGARAGSAAPAVAGHPSA